jgi:hypothetical protein
MSPASGAAKGCPGKGCPPRVDDEETICTAARPPPGKANVRAKTCCGAPLGGACGWEGV